MQLKGNITHLDLYDDELKVLQRLRTQYPNKKSGGLVKSRIARMAGSISDVCSLVM
jgi:hypothetical protein